MHKPDFTVLGFDFGLKHIGVAVGQTVTGAARPLDSLKANRGEPEWAAITALIHHWQPKALIVGIPLSIDGHEQSITRAARKFAAELEQRYHRYRSLAHQHHRLAGRERHSLRRPGHRYVREWDGQCLRHSCDQSLTMRPPDFEFLA